MMTIDLAVTENTRRLGGHAYEFGVSVPLGAENLQWAQGPCNLVKSMDLPHLLLA
jgi:hypothetical protein